MVVCLRVVVDVVVVVAVVVVAVIDDCGTNDVVIVSE